MLYFQYLTIQACYRKVAEAIKEKGLDANPADYILFTFPANRVEDPGTQNTSKTRTSHCLLPVSFIVSWAL